MSFSHRKSASTGRRRSVLLAHNEHADTRGDRTFAIHKLKYDLQCVNKAMVKYFPFAEYLYVQLSVPGPMEISRRY